MVLFAKCDAPKETMTHFESLNMFFLGRGVEKRCIWY